MRELIDWDKSNRYAVSLQNRLFKGFQGLALMNEQERISNTLTLTQEQKSAKQAPIELEGDCVSEASWWIGRSVGSWQGILQNEMPCLFTLELAIS